MYKELVDFGFSQNDCSFFDLVFNNFYNHHAKIISGMSNISQLVSLISDNYLFEQNIKQTDFYSKNSSFDNETLNYMLGFINKINNPHIYRLFNEKFNMDFSCIKYALSINDEYTFFLFKIYVIIEIVTENKKILL